MEISLTMLSQLEAGRSYYLSNTTGTIKRTGLWQWFKCVTGLGDGRAKAQRLAQVVKDSLLASAGISKDASLTADIRRFDNATYSLSGATLRDIANRFKTVHADAIAKNDARRNAYKIAEETADEKVKEWVEGSYVGINPEKPEQSRNYIKKLALYSVQHLVQNAADERKVPEDIHGRMRHEMQKVINAISTAEVMQVMQRSGPGFPVTCAKRSMGLLRFDLDELHFRAILAALISKNGPVPVNVFVRRLDMFQEELLQERKDALCLAPLEPPSAPSSGFIFAESAMSAYKAMESSEWHREA